MITADEIRLPRLPDLGVTPRISVRPPEAPTWVAGWECPGCGASMPSRLTGGFCPDCGCDLRIGRAPLPRARRRPAVGWAFDELCGAIFGATAQFVAALIFKLVV